MDHPIEDLTTLSNEDVEAALTDIAARAAELTATDPAEMTDEQIDEAERLAGRAEQLRVEQNTRAEAQAERVIRLDAALGRMVPVVEPEPEPEPVIEEAVVVEAIPATEVEVIAEAPVAVAAAGARPRAGTTAGLAARRPAAAAPKPAARHEFMQATAHSGMPESTALADPAAVAAAIVRKRLSFTNVPDGVHDEFVPIATGVKTIARTVAGDPVENFGILQLAKGDVESLAASGAAFCAPATPLYDFFRLAEPQNPVEDSLSVVQAPRGQVRYIGGACDFMKADAAAAIDMKAESAIDPANQATWKNCARVDCPPILDAVVNPISQCIYFGNLHYRTFPEQVAAFLEDVAVALASRKEVFYLDYIDSNSTAVSSTGPYGASRNLIYDWTTAAVAYRKRAGMRRTAPIVMEAPDWSIELLKLDIAMNQFGSPEVFNITDAQATAYLRDRNIVAVWYNDSATGRGQKFDTPQAAGALNKWPTLVTSYLHAPGTFGRMDGGTLDVGLVRDSTLNRTNDLQLFMEEWIGVLKLGCESIRLTSTVCPSGAGPAAVTPRTCP